MKKIEVLSYGEALVDFLPNQGGKLLRDVDTFHKTSGGAPANMAIGLARLGRSVGLMGAVGQDEFGWFLRNHLESEGVDVSGVYMTDEAKTGITFVSLDANGERSFMFFRQPSADTMFKPEDINVETIEHCSIFIAGSNLLVTPEVREATFTALDHARNFGKFIIIDPNIRLHLWENHDFARSLIQRLLSYADVVKLNDDEMEFLGASADAATFYHEELEPAGVKALIATRAERGAEVFCGPVHSTALAPKLKVVDTTGAGDGFVAGFVAGLCLEHEQHGPTQADSLRKLISTWDQNAWRRILNLGCWVGSTVCTQFGATTALPKSTDVPWDGLGF
ncbi:MAG: carbohydrate kinase [bacterium]